MICPSCAAAFGPDDARRLAPGERLVLARDMLDALVAELRQLGLARWEVARALEASVLRHPEERRRAPRRAR